MFLIGTAREGGDSRKVLPDERPRMAHSLYTRAAAEEGLAWAVYGAAQSGHRKTDVSRCPGKAGVVRFLLVSTSAGR